jgi:nucleoside-diphosphate-sugar epimerase
VKILVTGANGFLGMALVERLLAKGERDLRCLVRSEPARASIVALGGRYPEARVEPLVGTLATPAGAAAAVSGVDLVYHLAASLAGAPADIFLSTVVASKNLLDAAVAGRPALKMVLVSSFGVYGVAGLRRGSVVDEATPLEPHRERRDVYSHAKLRQELLFREYQARHGFPLVVLRPGVIYGCGGSRVSARVGLQLGGVFLHLGGTNLLPLTYVENCADALVMAGQRPEADGQTYNVVDDDLVTAKQYLDRYRREVRPLRVLRVPYPLLWLGSWCVESYSKWSKGQLPPVFTRYRTATAWRPTRFTNAKLKALGWAPAVPTGEGLRRAFEWYRENPL